MSKKLFGKNIEPDCSCCNNYTESDSGRFHCDKGRKIRNGKCRKFDYNPLLRIPKSTPAIMQFSKEDFVL